MSRFTRTISSFPRNFWTANTIELFERWAYYGIFNLLALYLTNSPETGALGFTQVEKGLIMGIVNAILYFLPIITGAIADKFGYKKILIIAFSILSSGYFLMGIMHSFATVFLTFFYVAIGAALFKPIIAATIAKTTNDSNSSLGFGIFYMIINIGGLIGPLVASELREVSWHYIFIMSSGAILLNLILVLLFYKEPERKNNTDSLFKSFHQIFRNIYTILKDLRFVAFLLIIVFAWTVFWQYFYSLPVFIEQWADTSPLYDALYSLSPLLAKSIGTSGGIILTEKIITLDALFIVAFQLIISTLVMKLPPLLSMSGGILINTLGLTVAFLTRDPFIIVFSILIFSLGEMAFSPKILEYIGRIAPPDKAALYMGTQFLPIALGNFLGGFVSGGIFDRFADKYHMAAKMMPGLSDEAGSLTSEQLYNRACELMNTDPSTLDSILWDTFHPGYFGLVLLGLGCLSVILLLIYNRLIKGKYVAPPR